MAGVLSAVIAAATIVTFWPALRVPFFFDDVGDIVGNPDIRQVWPPRWLTAGPPHSNALAGRPVSALSFAIVHALAGKSPVAHHAVNLLLHCLSALLLFEMIRRTLLLPRAGAHPPGTAAALGGAAAALWALHPLQTEPVAYAIERTELLWAFFYLATLYAAVRALEPERARAWTAVAVGACALGMGSKEVMVSAPLAVVAFDRVFLEAEQRRRRNLYAGLAATWLVLIALLLSGKQAAVALHADEPVTRWQYLWTQGKVITRYLRLVVWPHPLVITYGWPQVTPFAEGLPYFLVAALGAASAWALYRRHWAGFLGACFFMLLAPEREFSEALRLSPGTRSAGASWPRRTTSSPGRRPGPAISRNSSSTFAPRSDCSRAAPWPPASSSSPPPANGWRRSAWRPRTRESAITSFPCCGACPRPAVRRGTGRCAIPIRPSARLPRRASRNPSRPSS